jgi:hypothetical protein
MWHDIFQNTTYLGHWHEHWSSASENTTHELNTLISEMWVKSMPKSKYASFFQMFSYLSHYSVEIIANIRGTLKWNYMILTCPF